MRRAASLAPWHTASRAPCPGTEVVYASRSRAPFAILRAVAAAEHAIDLDEVVQNLVSLGLDELYVRNQFAGLPAEESWLGEIAALLAESEAALRIPLDMPLPGALFELIDALRQVGAKAWCGTTVDGKPGFALGGAHPRTFALHSGPGASVASLARAVAAVMPRAQQVLIANDGESEGELTLIVLERGTFVALRAAVGDDRLERCFTRAQGEAPGVQLQQASADLVAIDARARFDARLARVEAGGSASEGIAQRIYQYDPRVAWPADRERPPGDDFYAFCAGMANGSLVRCLTHGDNRGLANLLYRFALATCVGAHYDVAAARQNPGMSAQGVLGRGQLSWSWFIFEALGATEEAAISGRLLDHEWVRSQERSGLSQRQRAYYDLGAWLRTGAAGPALQRLFPLVALAEREGWEDPTTLEVALATHSELQAGQLTDHALFYLWPAPLYALARKADAQDLLPPDNPFLSRPLSIAAVDLRHETVLRLKEQLLRFSLLDEAQFAPLLDPLPVIVDVCITEVDEHNAHGRTMLAAHSEAEHLVVAPHAGRSMQPGEVWLFEVQGATGRQVKTTFDDLGDVTYNVAQPTGHWLQRI